MDNDEGYSSSGYPPVPPPTSPSPLPASPNSLSRRTGQSHHSRLSSEATPAHSQDNSTASAHTAREGMTPLPSQGGIAASASAATPVVYSQTSSDAQARRPVASQHPADASQATYTSALSHAGAPAHNEHHGAAASEAPEEPEYPPPPTTSGAGLGSAVNLPQSARRRRADSSGTGGGFGHSRRSSELGGRTYSARSGSFIGSLGAKLRREKYYAGTVPIAVKNRKSRFGRFMDKYGNYDILGRLFAPDAVPTTARTVIVNEPLPIEAYLPEERPSFFSRFTGSGPSPPGGKKKRSKGDSALDPEKDGGSGSGSSATGSGEPDPVPLQRKATAGTFSVGKDGKPKKVAPSWRYTSNQVITSKYNVVTFLPRNLLEQFRRIANVFFLVLVILQFFPRFTNVSPALAALPLLVVLAITALKDGYEDLKRHDSDRRINNLGVYVLVGGAWRNRNHTKAKQRSISFRGSWLWRLFGGGKGKGGDPSVAGDHVRDEPMGKIEDDRSSIGDGKKRHWWGARKRKIRKSGVPRGGVTAPGGGSVAGAIAEGDNAERRNSEEIYDDELEDLHHHDGQANGHPLERVATVPEASAEYTTPSHHSGGLHIPFGGSHQDGPPRWRRSAWEDLRVGDFIRLKDDEAVPADCVICATSEEEDVCYVETKNLDGETNLKARHAVAELANRCRTAKGCATSRFAVQAEAPDVNMFRLNAAVEYDDEEGVMGGGRKKVPVTLNTMLLRGTVVRNTGWVIGMVVYTGRDSKIVMNSGGTPSKRSKVERQMNPMVFFNLALLAAMCVFCAIGTHILERYYYDRNSYWTVGENLPDDNPNFNGLIGFFNAMITFQNIVPISLYISIEFVRTAQAFFIWSDDEICLRRGEENERRTLARSWNLSDDLGQVQYIFSDKTGTLTQNAMEFKQCSIGAVKYIGDGEVPENTIVEKQDHEGQPTNATVGLKKDSGSSSSDEPATDDAGQAQTRLPPEVLSAFHSGQLSADLAQTSSAQSQRIHGFMLNLALCHSVLAAEDDEGHIIYKAQSPDEAALVQAAADVGFIFLGREKNILKVQMPREYGGAILEWELLNVIEFSSARKRMSVFVKSIPKEGEEAQLLLLCKGADNIIKERLAQGQEEIWSRTDTHLAEFANDGLRTLCLAYKVITEDAYVDWAERYNEASTAIENREEKMETEADKIERDLQLLGATAIEDRLQDGVPEAIADFKTAGIKVWVATGDKLETAVAIGYSSNLLSQDMNLIVIRGGPYEPGRKSAYSQLRAALIQFFDGEELANNLVNQPPGLHDVDDDDDIDVRSPSMDRGEPRRARLQRSNTAASIGSDVVGANNGRRPGGYGLVIDGSSLTHAFNEPYTKELLLELSTRCDVVVCCRTSPLQKALIVKLVKDGLGVMCLAIGDGANDVSMIQAADVGVGVAGEEGLQAVNSSDYAIGQFKFLQRLLLVHGHWSYFRNSNMIVNFFEKEIIGIGILFFFQFYCAYSTTTVYEYTYILFWNVFWTLVPVIVMGVTDRNIPARVLMEVPQLYHYGRRGTLFGLGRFSWYMFEGIIQSAIVYFFILYTYDVVTAEHDGYEVGLYVFSTVMAIAAVFITNIYIGLNTYAWTWWWVFGVVIGPLLVVVYTAFYSAISPGWIWTFVYGNNHYLWPTAYFWFTALFTIILALSPRYLYKYWQQNYMPNDVDILREVYRADPKHDFAHDPRIHGQGVGAHSRTHSVVSLHSHRHGQSTGDLVGPDGELMPRITRQITDMSTNSTVGRLPGAYDRGGALRVHHDRSGSRFASLRRRGSKASPTLGADGNASRARSGSILSNVSSLLGRRKEPAPSDSRRDLSSGSVEGHADAPAP